MRKITADGVPMPVSATKRRPPGPKRDAPRVGELAAGGYLVVARRRRVDAVDRLGALVGDDQVAVAVEDHVRRA